MDICILHIGHRSAGDTPSIPPSPDRFQAAISPWLPEAKWHVTSAVNDPLPKAENYDGYLITGGKYSVFEQYDWQDRLLAFIRELDEKAIPLVGICYGHQAIATALGGETERSDKGWGIGLMDISLTDRPNWLQAPQRDLMLHSMHQDQVSKMPQGAKLFLASDFCPIGGFYKDKTYLAIQQHPDFTPEVNRHLIEKRYERIGAERADKALKSLQEHDDTPIAAQWIADFLRDSIAP
ncbi:MAG: type 1 glutamine amidotransferase [Cohaesibacter sp.]|nr:type 1 glutamine amidotransferase [Cohaesibacter sp.]